MVPAGDLWSAASDPFEVDPRLGIGGVAAVDATWLGEPPDRLPIKAVRRSC
jgi:hypothetical protein